MDRQGRLTARQGPGRTGCASAVSAARLQRHVSLGCHVAHGGAASPAHRIPCHTPSLLHGCSWDRTHGRMGGTEVRLGVARHGALHALQCAVHDVGRMRCGDVLDPARGEPDALRPDEAGGECPVPVLYKSGAGTHPGAASAHVVIDPHRTPHHCPRHRPRFDRSCAHPMG